MTLRAEAVSVELGNTRIVHEADLRVEPGEFLALLGPMVRASPRSCAPWAANFP